MSASVLLSVQDTCQQFKDESERSRPVKPLPTDRVSTSNQLRILRAWAFVSSGGKRPVTVNEVAHEVRMAASTVAMTNPFFSSTGLLQRLAVGTYIPSREVLLLEFSSDENSETAGRRLAPLLRQTWFGQTLLERLALGAIEECEAISLLEDASSASFEHRKPLEFLLEFMADAHLIERANGRIAMLIPAVPTVSLEHSLNGNHVQVNINIDSKDLANWGPEQIAAFFKGLTELIAAKSAA